MSDTKTDRKPLMVNSELHHRLKEKAKREGRVLQAMVEAKLEELVPTSARTLEIVK